MDLISELLPPSYLLKSENTAKDKRKNKTPYQNKSHIDDSEKSKPVTNKIAVSDWGSVDRRTGKDRRSQIAKRGRWLESRLKKDRRASDFKVSFKIHNLTPCQPYDES